MAVRSCGNWVGHRTAALDSSALVGFAGSTAFTYLVMFLFPSSVILPLALIYLVRVRHPTSSQQA